LAAGLLGDLAAALRAVERVVVLLRAVDRRAAGLRVLEVVVVVAICLISPFWLDPEKSSRGVPYRGYPSNTCL
jgi:hypothetical protein